MYVPSFKKTELKKKKEKKQRISNTHTLEKSILKSAKIWPWRDQLAAQVLALHTSESYMGPGSYPDSTAFCLTL